MTTSSADPQKLRRTMRRARRALSPEQRRVAALALARQVGRHPVFLRSRRIALYMAVNGEMAVDALMQRAWDMGKQIYLPVLLPYRHNRMWFACYRPGQTLVPNRFGIPEPDASLGQLVNPMALDLVLTPLVAFDRHCNRIGMGGGFYDRTFSFLRYRKHWRRPLLLGSAYEFQCVPDSLPRNTWDIPLRGVATETGMRWARA